MEGQSFKELLEQEEINELKKGKILKGKVFEIYNDGIWVALEKATGDVFVNQENLVKQKENYQIGEDILVKIVKINDAEGFNLASEKEALFQKLMNEIKEGKNYKAIFKNRLKKGYTVLIEGTVTAFLPGSLSLLKSDEKLPDNEVMVKVLSKKGRNIVVSRKDYVEEKTNEAFENYREGMIVEGIVEEVKPFGAFVKLSEYITALLPRSEMSWNDKVEIFDYIKRGQKIRGTIIKLDKEKRRFLISIKQLKENPWENIEERYPIGSVVIGQVKKIFPFGFTVEIGEGIEGLVHESEIFWGHKGKIRDIVEIGDRVEVKILNIDKNGKKINLSYKQAKKDPWEDIEGKYSEGNVVFGTVEKILSNGAIVSLEEGLTGFLHVSELSWNFVDDVANLLKEGEKIKVRIISINKEDRRIRLSLRKVEENPWKRVINEVKVGDVVKGKIHRFVDKGAIVVLEEYQVEAYLPSSKASTDFKDIREIYKIGDEVEAKVLEINLENENERGNMIISVSHLQEEREKEEAYKVMNEINS